MKWFKRKPKTENPNPETDVNRSFRERVDAFWDWWSRESKRIYAAVDDGGGAEIQPEISAQVSRMVPGMGWVFGPGENREGHSFTLTPEGNTTKRFLVEYWLSKAPELEGWTFYPARQASTAFGGWKIAIGDVEVSAESMWITPEVDEESECIDITVWSPTFVQIDRDKAMHFLFILLDEALGENGTSRCIGAVDVGDGKLDRSLPLGELPEYVDGVFTEHGWNKEMFYAHTYQREDLSGDYPRGDIFVGSSRDMRLIGSYFEEGGPFENPIEETGVDLVFLQFPAAIFPDGEQVAFRGDIEDAIEEKLIAADSGIVIGGAMGAHAGYIDLMLFDGFRGREIIAEVLAARGLGEDYQLFPFTR